MKLTTVLAACLWTAGCLCEKKFFVPRESNVPEPSIVDDAADIGVRNVDAGSSADLVTWDKYSFKINGERLVIFSGEFHPWRLPSPSLWLDVLHKVKALGFNTVSIYINWSLVEGTKGHVSFDGIFSYDKFFEAVREVGLYVILRPGPYINSELSAGGFPSWRFNSPEGIYWRVNNPGYYEEIRTYIRTVGELMAPHQITNNGSIILLQLDNELSSAAAPGTAYPPVEYFQFLEDQFREVGLTVPTFHNDVSHDGKWSNTPVPDIYAYDFYPLSCGALKPSLSQNDWEKHLNYAPQVPHFVAEYTCGFYDQPGGVGYHDLDACAVQLEPGITRIYYQNLYSMSVNALSLYMIYGGTNWGHMGWDKVYTSYDFRAAIQEDRTITREKYAEIKLEAQFLKASPSYTTSRLAKHASSDITGNPLVVTTETRDDFSNATFWTTRHADVTDTSNATYSLSLSTSQGELVVPQAGGSLSITGYDSKIHVSDYPVGNRTLLYSTADVLSWLQLDGTSVVFVYGRDGETHETAFIAKPDSSGCVVLEGSVRGCDKQEAQIIVNYNIVGQTVVKIDDDVILYILDRNEAYKFWFPELPTGKFIPAISKDIVAVKGPYLVRSAKVDGRTLQLTGDLNATETVEVIAPSSIKNVKWNGHSVRVQRSKSGSLKGDLRFNKPRLELPDLTTLDWKYHDSLVEVLPGYDDSQWLEADNKTTVNGARKLTTETDLYAGTYGYHNGNFLYRGHFEAFGNETYFWTEVHGGKAAGFSVWLDDVFLGSSAGTLSTGSANRQFNFTQPLESGKEYVVTVLTENKGYNENESGGITYPRGILNYNFGSTSPKVDWRITGSHGAELYVDQVRGPKNEGGFYAERQGWHLPKPPTRKWQSKSPLEGAQAPGVEVFTSSFRLNIDENYDTPLFVEIEGTADLRVHLFINGYKFGIYTENIGPQTRFPVPQGIINHRGENWIALILWSPNEGGGKLTKLSLGASAVIQWGYPRVATVDQPAYALRADAV